MLLLQAPNPNHLKLFWIPGHEEIEFNELSDNTAKIAAESSAMKITLDVNMSLLKRQIKSALRSRPEIFTTDKPLIFKTPPDKIWKALAKLEKGRASIIFQLRLGHIALNTYLYKHSNHETITSPNCETCGVPETTDHFLTRCRRFQQQRSIFHQIIRKEKSKSTLSTLQC